MRTEYSVFLVILLLFRLGVPAIACCEGDPPGECCVCEDGVWVWNCGPGQNCCGGGCCSNTCCNDTCCAGGQSCCGSVCYNTATQQCCMDRFPPYICGIKQICCKGICCDEKCCRDDCIAGICFPYCCKSNELCCLGICLTCPTQSAYGLTALCGTDYGGHIMLCYPGAENWWFLEHVTSGTRTCTSGEIEQTTDPVQAPTGCLIDEIINPNGPPQNVGPCSDTTYQTVCCGPTREKVYCCSYSNTQVITVSSGSSPGTVTTSSAGASVECSY